MVKLIGDGMALVVHDRAGVEGSGTGEEKGSMFRIAHDCGEGTGINELGVARHNLGMFLAGLYPGVVGCRCFGAWLVPSWHPGVHPPGRGTGSSSWPGRAW